MRLHIRTLRKIIREAISYDHQQKLWELLGNDPESYRQAWEMWDTLDPGGCPLPEDPHQWFDPEGEGPWILKLFAETPMALEDPDYYFEQFCSASWEDPKEALLFNFNFSFTCGDENAEYDFGMGERSYVVPGTDRDYILRYIKEDIEAHLDDLTSGTWWNNWVDIHVDISDQKDLTELENGWCNIYVKYNQL